MKHRIGPVAGALGCVVLLVVACGGSSFEGVGGSAGSNSGGESTAGASGKTSGGSASGGTASGGTTSAGSSNGGSNSGGTNRGGTSNGGSASGGVSSAGSANGGAASGGSAGNPSACEADTDCAACRYATAPKSEMDCYCPSCGQTPLSKATCTANQTAWQKQCSQAPILCPAIACVEPPIPQCKSHTCVVTM